ncbi:MAG: hypothetical protein R2873_08265 [Caldilineaceae bacterium]
MALQKHPPLLVAAKQQHQQHRREASDAMAGVADVAREDTIVYMFGGQPGQFEDTGLGNPYATGATHQIGSAALWEPLYFFSAFAP